MTLHSHPPPSSPPPSPYKAWPLAFASFLAPPPFTLPQSMAFKEATAHSAHHTLTLHSHTPHKAWPSILHKIGCSVGFEWNVSQGRSMISTYVFFHFVAWAEEKSDNIAPRYQLDHLRKSLKKRKTMMCGKSVWYLRKEFYLHFQATKAREERRVKNLRA